MAAYFETPILCAYSVSTSGFDSRPTQFSLSERLAMLMAMDMLGRSAGSPGCVDAEGFSRAQDGASHFAATKARYFNSLILGSSSSVISLPSLPSSSIIVAASKSSSTSARRMPW